MHQYKIWIAIFMAFVLVIVAIALSAVSLQESNEALANSLMNTEAIESEKYIIVDKNAAEQSGAAIAPSIDKITNNPTRNPTPNPTPNPTADEPTTNKPTTIQPTSSPTEPHPLNPQWFQTTHADYKEIDTAMTDDGPDGDAHSFRVAQNMCYLQDLELCPYDAYCPNGKGHDPFNGGPPKTSNWGTLKETQWAPFYSPDQYTGVDIGKHWVQIGLIPASQGGDNDNDFVKCWSHEDWYAGGGEDVENIWEEEHRMWILCCTKPTDL